MKFRFGCPAVLMVCAISGAGGITQDGARTSEPYVGVTYITRSETSTTGRPVNMHILKIDVTAPGIRFRLSPPAPSEGRETTTQSTVAYLNQEGAQAAVNVGFFLPVWPARSTPYPTDVIGLEVSDGDVYSGFEIPSQNYAIVPDAPGINIDKNNQVCIVHSDTGTQRPDDVKEGVTLWNAFAGSAQIVTAGVKTIPCYRDSGGRDCVLAPGHGYNSQNSWYDAFRARTVAGLSKDHRSLWLFTVDEAGGSAGMRVEDVADLLIRDYDVYDALNLDGGGSTTMALRDPVTGNGHLVNTPSNEPAPRLVGSSLAIFAQRNPGTSSGLPMRFSPTPPIRAESSFLRPRIAEIRIP